MNGVFQNASLAFFSTPLPLFPCFRSRSHFLDGLSRKRLLRKLTFPTAPSIRLQFRFEIREILRVQWNGTFRSHRPDPGDRSFNSHHIFCNFSFLLACIKSLTMNNTISLEKAPFIGAFPTYYILYYHFIVEWCKTK